MQETKNMSFKKIFIAISTILITFPSLALAADIPSFFGFDTSSPQAWINSIYRYGISLVALLALAGLIYGGFRYLTSAGNEEAVTSGKEAIFAALTGLVIMLFSHMILKQLDPRLVELRLSIAEVDLPDNTSNSSSDSGSESGPWSGSAENPSCSNSEVTSRYADKINQIARSNGIDPHYMAASIRRESNFNADAGPSPTGAYGLVQFQPDTAANMLPSSAPSSCRNRISGSEYSSSRTGYCLNRGGQDSDCCTPEGSFQVCGRWGDGCQEWMRTHPDEQVEAAGRLLSYFINAAGGDYQLATGMMMYGEAGCRSNEDQCRNNVGPDNRGNRRTCSYWRDSCRGAGGEFTVGYCQELL